MIKNHGFVIRFKNLRTSNLTFDASKFRSLTDFNAVRSSRQCNPNLIINKWLARELKWFKTVDDGHIVFITLGSVGAFVLSTLVVSFPFFVCYVDNVENNDNTDQLTLLQNTRPHNGPAYNQIRAEIEKECYRRIIESRKHLEESFERFKNLIIGASSISFGYYLVSGHYLGISPITNFELSTKRLLHRKSALWSCACAGYIVITLRSIQYFYETYILSPKFRAMSLLHEEQSPELKRKFMTAYGGRGMALQRLINNEDFDDDELFELARQVAFHKKPQDLDLDIRLIKSRLFKWGYGLQIRTELKCDQMPQHCWFHTLENIKKFQTLLEEQKVKSFKETLRKIKEAERKQLQEKLKPPRQSVAQTKESGEIKEDKFHFAVGMAYGSEPSWNSRFLKASNAELLKAAGIRLKVLQLSQKTLEIQNMLENESWMQIFRSTLKTLKEFINCRTVFTNQKYLVKNCREQHCLCDYYPYYVGLFIN